MNIAGLSGLRGVSDTGVWFRAVDPRYLSSALQTLHTPKIRSRFSDGPNAPIPFETLYLAESPNVALFEVQSLFGSPLTPGGVVAHPKRAFVTLNLSVHLTNVLDLNDPANQAALGTNAQELTGDWLGYSQRSNLTSVPTPVGSAPTQELGHAVFAAGYEGIRTLSARLPYYQTLLVFPTQLAVGSRVTGQYRDASGVTHTLSIP